MKSASGLKDVDFAEPANVRSIDDCFFYHVIDLPGIGVVAAPQAWDLRGRFGDYTGGVPLRGKSFLDVGPASGFISFEAEKHGCAEVYSFDASDPEDLDLVPYADIPGDSPRSIFERMRLSYWFAHQSLNSNVKAIYGNIYKMADLVPKVDVVLLAQILVHLERPIRAIVEAAKSAKDTLIIVDGSFEDDRPMVVFLGGKGNYYSWYHHSVGFYRDFLPVVGFDLVSAKKNVYRSAHPHIDNHPQVWTFVAKRASSPLKAWS